MKIIEVKDIDKKITVELSYDEWFEIIYFKEKDKRENIVFATGWAGKMDEIH